MFIGVFAQTKWREPYLVGRCLGAAENVRFIGCYGGSKPPPYGVGALPFRYTKPTDKSKFEMRERRLASPVECYFLRAIAFLTASAIFSGVRPYISRRGGTLPE